VEGSYFFVFFDLLFGVGILLLGILLSLFLRFNYQVSFFLGFISFLRWGRSGGSSFFLKKLGFRKIEGG